MVLKCCTSMQIWNVKTMEHVAELTGHDSAVSSLQVIEDPARDTKLFSASNNDKTMRVSTSTSPEHSSSLLHELISYVVTFSSYSCLGVELETHDMCADSDEA